MNAGIKQPDISFLPAVDAGAGKSLIASFVIPCLVSKE